MPSIGEAGLRKLSNILKDIWRYRINAQIREEAYDILRKRERPNLEDAVKRGLMILAVDHPARMNFSVGNDKYALLDRGKLLTKVFAALMLDEVDGILLTADILDELLILVEIVENELDMPLKKYLGKKIIIGSINRGGLSGSIFELDDRVTAFRPSDIAKLGLDGAKFLLRIDLSDDRTLNTLTYAHEISRECSDLKLPLFIEVFPVRKANNGYAVIDDPYELAAVVNVASGLGYSTFNRFLKLPFTRNFQIVAKSTTLPIMMLGGGSGDSGEFIKNVKEALLAGNNVVGVVAGRNILFPSDSEMEDVIKKLRSIIDYAMKNKEATNNN